MEPASRIISLFGGNKAVASILGLSSQTVANWKQPRRPHNGAGGEVPARHIFRLLSYAAEHKIPVTLDDFKPRSRRDAA